MKGLIISFVRENQEKSFSVRPKGNHEYRKELLIMRLFDWKKLTVMFQEYSGEGVPRFLLRYHIRDYE